MVVVVDAALETKSGVLPAVGVNGFAKRPIKDVGFDEADDAADGVVGVPAADAAAAAAEPCKSCFNKAFY